MLWPGVPEAFLAVLDEARHAHRFRLWAYVVMPEHVHVLLWPEDETHSMSEILKGMESPAAKAIFALYPELWESSRVTRRGRPDEFRFWQIGGGYDRNVIQSKVMQNSIRQMHANPVRKGLCECETDWE